MSEVSFKNENDTDHVRKINMCQTTAISNKMVRLGRSYSHCLDVVSPNGYNVAQLTKLNRVLDGLNKFIYDDWRTITEDDHRVFGD